MNPTTSRLTTLLGTASFFTMYNVIAAYAQEAVPQNAPTLNLRTQYAQADTILTRPQQPQQVAQAATGPAPQQTAQAQTAQTGAGAVPEQVLVTGSLIHGTAAVGVPVTNLGTQDFTESGAITIGDLFRTVPVANVAPGPSAVNSGGHQERETRVNIRGLDSTGPRSLLMIDGIRLPPQADGLCAIDPSIIPSLALDRVDVLADGASATYGSDAIAGVINIVLKRGYDGALTELHVGQPTDGGGTQLQAQQLFGRTWDGGDITFTYQWTDEKAVKGKTHSKFTTDFAPWGLANPFVPIGASIPGTVSIGAPNVSSGVRIGTACTNCYSIPRGTGADWTPGAGGVGPTAPGSAATVDWATLLANPGANNWVDPLTAGWEQAAQQSNSAVLTFDQNLFPSISFFATGFYTNRRVQEILPSFGGQGLANYLRTYVVPTTNPYYPTGAPTNLRISYDLAAELPPTIPAFEVTWRYQFGFNLDLPFDWTGQVYYSRSYEDVAYIRHIVSANGVNVALGNTVHGVTLPATVPYLNPFCDPYSFQCNSPATLAYIGAMSTQGAQYSIAEKGARFDGPLFDLPGGQVKMAVGALYDGDNVVGWSGNNTGTPGNLPLNQFVTYDHEPYHIWAEFAQLDVPIFGNDLSFPLMRKLDLEASVRHDTYGGNVNLTGSTTNPKIAFTWLLDDMVGATVRGSWGSSFRFANEGEFSNVLSPVDQSANIAGSGQNLSISCGGGGQPTAGSAAADLFAAGFGCGTTPGGIAYGGGPQAVMRVYTDASTGNVITRQGGVALAPEKSINYSIGLELAPQFELLKGLDVQATWYSVKLNGILNGFLADNSSSALADPTRRFHFIVPSDLGCPASANANPTTCAPFQTMVRAALLDPNTDSDISQLDKVYWLNDSGTTNSGFIHVEGIDFNASYDWDMGDIGAWNVGVTGTYYLHWFNQSVAGGPITDNYHQNLNAIGGVAQDGVETLPRLNYRARVGWSEGPYTATLFYNYSSHYFETRVGVPPNVNNQCTSSGGSVGGGTFPCAITGYTNIEPSFSTFDLSLGYDTGDIPENDYLKDITIQLTVQNLMGIHSPFEYGPTSVTRNPAGYDRNRPDIGRVVGLTLLKKW